MREKSIYILTQSGDDIMACPDVGMSNKNDADHWKIVAKGEFSSPVLLGSYKTHERCRSILRELADFINVNPNGVYKMPKR